MRPPLYEPHPNALSSLFGDLENYSRSQGAVLLGTPGSILKRKNSGGFEFYAHQYYDVNRKKIEKYVAGPVGSPEADAIALELGEKIRSLSAISKNTRLLGREGFKIVDNKTFAAVATLCNNGLFTAGAVLIGSHAYGVLLNQLGVRAAQYATMDVDIARGARLAFDAAPASFLEMLRESRIQFVENPRLNNRDPSTSFGEAGKSPFQVDLFVPANGKEIETIEVPELQAYATGLPYLGYLLGDYQEATVLAKEGCCRVRVPSPERFALHKLIVSELRKIRSEKSVKDISQAAVLLAVLAERHPGAIEEAAKAIPSSVRKLARRAYSLARVHLEAHECATETLDAIFEPPGDPDEKEKNRIVVRESENKKIAAKKGSK